MATREDARRVTFGAELELVAVFVINKKKFGAAGVTISKFSLPFL